MIPKFRAWFTPFKGKKFGQEMKYGQAGSLITHAEMSPDNYVLMQSTGLKDKNGVEIFEGDIVQSFSNINRISDPHLTETIEPKYKNKIVIFTNGAFVLSDDGKREYGGVLNHYVGSMVKDLEVIGNIYENPELLEGSRGKRKK